MSEIADVASELARKMHLWYSIDAETGPSEAAPNAVRLAYLKTDKDDLPEQADLVLRWQCDYGLRDTIDQKAMLSPLNSKVDVSAACIEMPVFSGGGSYKRYWIFGSTRRPVTLV